MSRSAPSPSPPRLPVWLVALLLVVPVMVAGPARVVAAEITTTFSPRPTRR